MKNTLEGTLLRRLGDTEARISNLEDRIMENTQSKKNKFLKNEDSLRDLWDNIKHTNILIIGVPEEERAKLVENIFGEIMAENFLNLKKETDTQVQ